MRVDENLNIVVPIGDGATPALYAVSIPVSRLVFEAHFRVLSLLHAEIISEGGAYLPIGIRCAALLAKEIGTREASKRGASGDSGVSALLAEIQRLTTILAPDGDRGWEDFPVPSAINAGHLSAEEWEEVHGAILFFTGAYWLAASRKRAEMAQNIASMLGWSLTPSTPAAFGASLTPLSGARPLPGAGASVPS